MVFTNGLPVKPNAPIPNFNPNPIFLLYKANPHLLALAMLAGVRQSLLGNTVDGVFQGGNESAKTYSAAILDLWPLEAALFLNKVPDKYIIYIDGKETWRTKAGGVSQVPEYVLLSDEIGKWGGDIKKARLPDKFLVDYVRVYDLVKTR